MAITSAYRTRSDALPLRSFKAKGRPSAIAGMGVYAPDKIITNFDLGGFADGSPDRLAALTRRLWQERGDQSAVAGRCREYIAARHSPEVIGGQWRETLGINRA